MTIAQNATVRTIEGSNAIPELLRKEVMAFLTDAVKLRFDKSAGISS
jgi:hypothetical protein